MYTPRRVRKVSSLPYSPPTVPPVALTPLTGLRLSSVRLLGVVRLGFTHSLTQLSLLLSALSSFPFLLVPPFLPSLPSSISLPPS